MVFWYLGATYSLGTSFLPLSIEVILEDFKLGSSVEFWVGGGGEIQYVPLGLIALLATIRSILSVL